MMPQSGTDYSIFGAEERVRGSAYIRVVGRRKMIITLSQCPYMQNLKHNLEKLFVVKFSYPDDHSVLRPSSSFVSM